MDMLNEELFEGMSARGSEARAILRGLEWNEPPSIGPGVAGQRTIAKEATTGRRPRAPANLCDRGVRSTDEDEECHVAGCGERCS